MTEVLHLGALLPAAVGACCTVGGRRGVVELGSSLVMLAAMLDLASGVGLVVPLLWAAALVILAVVSAGRLRFGHPASAGAGGPGSIVARSRHRSAMVVHTSGGLLIMAALVCAMASHPASGVHAETSMSTSMHHAGGISAASMLLALAIAGYVALSVRLALGALRRRRRLVAVELSSMAVSVMAMGFAVVA